MGAQGRQKGSGGSTSLLCNFSTHFIQCRTGFVVLVRRGFTKLESPAIGASAIPRTIDNSGNFMHWEAGVDALMTPHRAGSDPDLTRVQCLKGTLMEIGLASHRLHADSGNGQPGEVWGEQAVWDRNGKRANLLLELDAPGLEVWTQSELGSSTVVGCNDQGLGIICDAMEAPV